jgi:serine/threonine protein phosphatase 1
MRTYAIGDIHGHLNDLRAAHARIARDRERTGDAEAPVVHLGDMVDRGPDSAGVVAMLAQGIAAGQPWMVLKGNHDRYFHSWLSRGDLYDPRAPQLGWLHPRLGGAQTLASYGIDPEGAPSAVHRRTLAAVPAAHRDFLAGLPLWHRRGPVLFVHAGIRPGIAPEDQTENDLVWIRDGFLNDPRDHGLLVVHGHTSLARATHHGNRVNLDSSMAYGGQLTVAVFEDRDVFVLTDSGRLPLLP